MLKDVRIIEFAGIGPGAMAGTVLADLGARVLRVDRPVEARLGAPKGEMKYNLLRRNRSNIALDLKNEAHVDRARELICSADVLIEGFRPGVMERLGLGPEACRAANPALVYARVTGWGQTGPLASMPGHDINYIGLTGVLNAIGRHGQPPTVPLSLLGDMAGGGMYTVAGVLAGLLEARRTGHGSVVDVSIVDAVANLATSFYGRHQGGAWHPERGSNYLDSGAPFYDVYECADGKWLAVGAIERKFFLNLIDALGLAFDRGEDHFDRQCWPLLRRRLQTAFEAETRDAWWARLKDAECCVTPVLSPDEAMSHPHLVERGTFMEAGGVRQPGPAIHFDGEERRRPSVPLTAAQEDPQEALAAWLA